MKTKRGGKYNKPILFYYFPAPVHIAHLQIRVPMFYVIRLVSCNFILYDTKKQKHPQHSNKNSTNSTNENNDPIMLPNYVTN